VEHLCTITLGADGILWALEPVDPDDEDGEKSSCLQEVEDFQAFGPPEVPVFLKAPKEILDGLCSAAGAGNPAWRQPLQPEVAAFFAAAKAGDIGKMAQYLQAGGDIKVRDHHGRNALWHAAEQSAIEPSRWLIEHGADLNVQDRYGSTVLMNAAFRGDEARADLYRLSGADLTLHNGSGKTAWLEGVESKASHLLVSPLRACVEEDWPLALHTAARISHTSWLDGEEWYVEGRKLEMNRREGRWNWTPLQAHFQGYEPRTQAANWLVAHGADLTVVDEMESATILHFAARESLPWLVAPCLAAGVDIDAKNRAGHTALSLALEKNERPQLIAELLKASPDLQLPIPCQPWGKDLAQVSAVEKAARMGLVWSHWLLARRPAQWSGLCCYARLSPAKSEPEEDPPPGSVWLEFPAEWCAASDGELEARLLRLGKSCGADGPIVTLLSQVEALKQPGGWPGRKLWAVFPDETVRLVDRFRDERPREIVADPATFRAGAFLMLHREWKWQARDSSARYGKFLITLRRGVLTWTESNMRVEQPVERFRVEGPPRSADFHTTIPRETVDEICALIGDTARLWEIPGTRKERLERVENWQAVQVASVPVVAPAPPPHQSGKWCYARIDIEDHFTTATGAGSDGSWECWMEFPAEWCYCQPAYLESWLTDALRRAYVAMNEEATADPEGGHYSLERCWPEVLTRAGALRQPWTECGKVLYSVDERERPPVPVPDEEKRRPLLAMGDPAKPPQPIPISPPPLRSQAPVAAASQERVEAAEVAPLAKGDPETDTVLKTEGSRVVPAPKNSPTAALAGMLIGLVAGIGMVALGVFVLTLLPRAWREMNEVWEEGPGVILGVGIKAREVRTGNEPQHYDYTTMHTVVLDCRYTVGGKEFAGKELPAPRQAGHPAVREEAMTVAESYRPGESIAVFHDPADPSRARLEAGGPNGLFWFIAMAGPISILAGAGLAWWAWVEWRKKRGILNRR
jgi:ankyrin repeat protein